MTCCHRRRPADRGAAVRVVIVLALAALVGSRSHAEVLLYNYLQNSTASFTGSGYTYNAYDFRDNREALAERFVTQVGGNVITDVKVNLWTGLPNAGTFTVSLYSDSSNAVGTRVATLGTRDLSTIYAAAPGTLTSTTFSGLSLGLTPTTSYWIVVENSSGVVGSGMYWGLGGTGSSAYVSPNPTSAARFNFYTTPQWSNVSVPALGMQVTAVPEPAAGDVTWNVPSGNWNVGSNWSGGLTPFASGTAIIDGGRTALLGSGGVGTASRAIVANTSTGTMSLSGGQLTATSSIVGMSQGSNGTVTISSGSWTNSGDLELGRSGTATMQISGGRVSNATGYLGNYYVTVGAQSRGSATVTGGTWANTGDLYVGWSGVGSLTVNGGNVTNANGIIAHLQGSSGSATITGGTWATAGSMVVGGSGSATMTLTGGAVRVNSGTGILTLASAAGSVGTLNLGTGTTVGTLVTSTITGGAGTGTVNVNVPGTYTLSTPLTGTLAVNQAGSGIMILRGSNTYAGTTSVTAGSLQVDSNARMGSSALTLNGGRFRFGAAFNDLRAITLGTNSGTLDTNGFSVASSSVITGSGGLTKTGFGGLTLSASNSYSGGTTITTGKVTVTSGGSINHAANAVTIAFGSTDAAALGISGGSVTSSTGFLGAAAGSSGGATVTSGTWASVSDLYVGYSGTGALVIDGGRVSNVHGFVANNAGSSGSVTVTSGTWANSGNLEVGSSGNGSLVVSGGSVTNTTGYVGSGGASTATISGGTWANSTALFIGLATNGTLNLTGSGAVTVGAGSGTVTLARYSGASATLNIGTGGAAGTLTAGIVTGSRAGAAVNFNHTGDTTFAPAMIGTLAVTKAGPGTTTLSGINTFTGTTTVSAGLLQIDADSRLGASTLTLTGGGIRYGAAFNDLRAATLSGSGGTFDTNGFTVSNALALSGTGGVTKTGLGSLTLAGNKSYSGGTTITQGTLVAGAAGAFGSSGIIVSGAGTLDLGGYAVTNVITNAGGSIVNAAAYGGSQSVTGTVSITGTIGGTVTVTAAGELKGNQTVFNGPVSLAAGARHSPGTSPGTQSFTSGLSYDAGSILTWELVANSGTGAGTNYDFLSVTGGSLSIADGATLDLVFDGGGSSVAWNDPFWNAGHSWTIIDISGSASSTGDFTLGMIGNDAVGQSLLSVRPLASFEIDRSGSDVLVTYVVPEPSTLTTAVLGLAFGWSALLRRRGCRYSSP